MRLFMGHRFATRWLLPKGKTGVPSGEQDSRGYPLTGVRRVESVPDIVSDRFER